MVVKKAGKKVTKKVTKVTGPASYTFEYVAFKQGTHDIYLFYASAKDLNKICTADQYRESKQEDGYQRIVSPTRRRKIAKHVDQGKLLPLSILITFNHFTLNKANSTITIPSKKTSGWIIDGQHRLAGAGDAESDILLPVVAFTGLSKVDQIDLFVTINREQKGVPTSLYFELLKHLPKNFTEKEMQDQYATDLANILKADEESPFLNRIVISTSPANGQISLTNFVRKISPQMKKGSGRLFPLTFEERAGVLNNLYNGLKSSYPKEFSTENCIFYKTLGFGAIINVLPDIFDLSVSMFKGFTVQNIVHLFNQIPEFDPTAWKTLGTGSAAELNAAEDLRLLLLSLRENSSSGGLKLK